MQRIALIILGVAVTLVAACVGGVALIDRQGWLLQQDGQLAFPALSIVVLFGVLAVVIPVGLLLVRDVRRINSCLTQEASNTGATVRAPGWLGETAGVVDQVALRVREAESEADRVRRDLEVRLRVSESEHQRDRSVLDALSDLVIVSNAFDEVIFMNATAARSFGVDPDTFEGQPIARLLDADLARQVSESREHGAGNGPRLHERVIDLADGPVTFDVSMECVADHRDRPAGVVTILHDLTRERELAQLKTDFVAKASHELRTPLSSIRAYVEMLVDGEATDEASRTDFYQIIQAETDRLGRLIDNMLNISKIEAGIVQIDRTQVDLGPIVSRAIETLEPQAAEKEITLTPRLTDVDLKVEGDEDMIYQVVLNLVSNAVKYTPEGGRVTISADSDNLTRSVVVNVADTGLGIPPDAVEKVFDKFYRVDNYKRVAKGTGLGLSLCKHIVETLHRGQIGVESQLGMGSKFWFSIPMTYAGSRAAA